MEVSFKFNNGETGPEMVAAILSLFGHSVTERVGDVSRTVATGNTGHIGSVVTVGAPSASGTMNPADNPAVGADPEDSGPASNAAHDASGMPWDGRIHSKNKTMTDKGLWRKLKGVDDITVAQVTRELQAAGKIVVKQPGAVVAAPQPQPPQAPQVPQQPVATTAIPPAQQPLPGVGNPVPTTVTVTQPVPAMAPLTPPQMPQETAYQKFVQFLAQNMSSPANPQGRLTQEWISAQFQAYGIVDANGVGSVQALEAKGDDYIKGMHNAVAGALGLPPVYA